MNGKVNMHKEIDWDKKVYCYNGSVVTLLHKSDNPREGYPYVVLFKGLSGFDQIRMVNKFGQKYSAINNAPDRIVYNKIKKKSGWINIYSDGFTSYKIYDTVTEAIDTASGVRDIIDTVKVEWEE